MTDESIDPMVTFTASAGHAEYWAASVLGLDVDEIWNPVDEDLENLGPDELVALWTEKTGIPMPEYLDPYWEVEVRWTGRRSTVIAGLVSLLTQLQRVPSGDDDVFDYWPSGGRYALAIAEHLGEIWVHQVTTTLLDVLPYIDEEFRGEIRQKVGI